MCERASLVSVQETFGSLYGMKRAGHALAQGAIVAALTFLLTWGIVIMTNPVDMFDQSSAGALAADTFSVVGGFLWPLYVVYALAIAILDYTIRYLGKRWRTLIAFGAAAVLGGIPVIYGLITWETDLGIMMLYYFGLCYLPFVIAATLSAGCTYGFILPSKRRRWYAR